MKYHNPQKQGFALLMALIVVSVVVSIGLSVLDLTLKQLRLSTNSKDSEIVFHATNAGLECARYIRNSMSDEIEAGNDITPECFGNVPEGGVTVEADSGIVDVTGGDAHLYEMDFSWDTTGTAERCSMVKILAIVSNDDTQAEASAVDIADIIPGYPESSNKICAAGGRCTIVSIQGFNRGCSNIGESGTIQREVLLEL